jgi:hypothetical protein
MHSVPVLAVSHNLHWALRTGQVVADPEQAELCHFACVHPSPLAPSLLARTHPQNDIGYQVIAETVAAALKAASRGPVSID